MDNKFKEYKDDFIKDNFFSKGAEIEVGEYKKYNKEEKADIYVEKSADETRYYKKDIFELSDEELALGIKIENYKVNEQMNKNIESVPNKNSIRQTDFRKKWGLSRRQKNEQSGE